MDKDKYKDLHSKTVFDFTDDIEILTKALFWKGASVTPEMWEKEKLLLQSKPTANRSAFIKYARLIGDSILESEAENQFYKEYRAIFNE